MSGLRDRSALDTLTSLMTGSLASSKEMQISFTDVSPHSHTASPGLHFPRGSKVHCAAPEAQQENSELCSKHTAQPRDKRLSLEAMTLSVTLTCAQFVV
ncbi:hypothetical protein Baya_10700 [Bagarius yarrelli]|uniref:Uncharacterized protein n=1 Tax=Bagarius yarrelli TaxID=175774 RepID=A0A556UG85_BAGYA|nr:hypothetical protein Baya_10700 [Bagarius yarrelli]